ncbi:MAG: 3-oxoacyl-ACP synthase, partial [Pseudomonadota bacterium]
MTNQPLHHPSRSGCAFAGFGHYVPENVITNAQLEQDLGLDDGWIEKRTGITERRWASADQPVSDLAIAAGQMALQEAQQKVNRDAISLLILATSTPDHLLPPTAPKVAQALSLSNAGAFDVAGACAGFIYAVTMADAFVRQTNRAAMVIAAN